MNKLRALLVGSRPWSFPMTLVSVFTGTLLAASVVKIGPMKLLFVVLGTVLFHGATNLANDYYDYASGVDTEESPTAKYRDQPLLEEWVEPGELRFFFAILYFFVAVIGGYLTYLAGLPVLGFGLGGFVASYLYTGGGLQYKYLGWGEFSVFLVWGPLMVTGSYYVQTGAVSWRPVLVSIPIGLLVALVLLANNLRDRSYDNDAGVKTIATLLDEKDGLIVYFLLVMATYSVLGYLIVGGILSLWAMLVFLSCPWAYRLLREFVGDIPDDADARTAELVVVFGGSLILALILEVLLWPI